MRPDLFTSIALCLSCLARSVPVTTLASDVQSSIFALPPVGDPNPKDGKDVESRHHRVGSSQALHSRSAPPRRFLTNTDLGNETSLTVHTNLFPVRPDLRYLVLIASDRPIFRVEVWLCEFRDGALAFEGVDPIPVRVTGGYEATAYFVPGKEAQNHVAQPVIKFGGLRASGIVTVYEELVMHEEPVVVW